MAREYCVYKAKTFTESQAKNCSAHRSEDACYITGDKCEVLEKLAQSPSKRKESNKPFLGKDLPPRISF